MSYDLKLLRLMAWERAKGEMRSILPTYCESVDGRDSMEMFEAAYSAIEGFIKHVEDNGIGGLG